MRDFRFSNLTTTFIEKVRETSIRQAIFQIISSQTNINGDFAELLLHLSLFYSISQELKVTQL